MQRTPGIYTDINTQTQRTGLPSQDHYIVFVTGDATAPANPTPIYDTASADDVSGTDSNAGRMMAAALTVSQGVRVDTVGKDGAISCTPTTLEFVPKVILPEVKDEIILRVVLEVNGKVDIADGGFVDLRVTAEDINGLPHRNTPEWIANNLFIYGLFLYDNINFINGMAVGYFDSDPQTNLESGQLFSIMGMQKTPDAVDLIDADVKLTFKVIDDLPVDAVDFTLEQWGQEVSVYGCAMLDQIDVPE